MSVSIPGYRDVTPAGPHRCPPLPDRVSDYATPVGTRLQCEECGKAYELVIIPGRSDRPLETKWELLQ